MQVVQLLFPKFLCENADRVRACLPEPSLAIFAGKFHEGFGVTGWQVLAAIICQVSSCKLANIVKGLFEPLRVELGVKDNDVSMGGHDDIGINAQTLFLNGIIETVCDNFASFLAQEDRQPFNDGEGSEVKSDAINDAKVFQSLPSLHLCFDYYIVERELGEINNNQETWRSYLSGVGDPRRAERGQPSARN
jgi:hypothetical protein